MCGIAGILSYLDSGRSGELLKRNSAAIVSMQNAPSLQRRGPDHSQSAFLKNNNDDQPFAWLASTRLAITDHQNPAANMPMFSPDGRFVLVYNGQIYNFQALRDQLGADYNFQTQSDTEIIIAGYLKWGCGVLDRLEGMFAFCLVDRTTQQVLLAVDHAGQKPLYYFVDQDSKQLLFASDIDTLLTSGYVPFDIAVTELQEHISQRYIRDEKTYIRNMYKMLNGQFLLIDLSKPQQHPAQKRYYHLPVADETMMDVEQASRQLSDVLLQSFDLVVTNSEIKPHFLLSGGIDSSSLVALAAEKFHDLHTYTIGFRYRNVSQNFASETELIDDFLQFLTSRSALQVEHENIFLEQDDHIDLIEEWINCVPHLLYNRDASFLYKIFKTARDRNCKVAITGCGPDEIFDGYGYGDKLEDAFIKGLSLEKAHYRSSIFWGNLDLNALLWQQEEVVEQSVAEKIFTLAGSVRENVSPRQYAQYINWHTRSQY